ncbi:latrophilin Cirl [Caerostris darwini]|uniref:Latrophilin Cirl n=1 Tax=Caerostris darwini TaxID=1538125 RepID=A0AAV4UDI8_9ARAC|nr:latrophilin Cirl [Caerostris darwini]
MESRLTHPYLGTFRQSPPARVSKTDNQCSNINLFLLHYIKEVNSFSSSGTIYHVPRGNLNSPPKNDASIVSPCCQQSPIDVGGPDSAGYRTTYACEGNNLSIVCDEGLIHLIRANYGRFSISICNDHGNLDWRVNCMSQHSFLIMQKRCSLQTNCSIEATSSIFQDPCPGTLKYLEVQYHCGTGPPVLTTPTTSSVKVTYVTNVTAIPIGKIHTVTQRPVISTAIATLPTIPFLRTTTSTPKRVIPTITLINKSEIFTDYTAAKKVNETVPTMGTVTAPKQTTTASTTTVFFNEGYCPPTFSRGINWPWTKVGESATANCPDGAAGTAKWHCENNPAQWIPEYPDLLECHSLWLENLRVRLQSGDPIVKVTSDLAVMSSAKPLFTEDIKIISDLTQQALYKSVNMENFLDTWHKFNVLHDLLQYSVQTLSNLLENRQESAWKDLHLNEKKMIISTFLERLDESALLLAETSSDDSSFSVIKSNVWLSLQVLKTKNTNSLYFPTITEISSEAEGIYWLNIQDKIVLPLEAVEDYEKNGFYKVVFYVFNKLNDHLIPSSSISHYPLDHSSENTTRIVNSRIIGASLERKGKTKLSRPASITLKHLIEGNVTNPVCVYWDFHLKDWSAKGCWVESSNKTYTTCLCDHLTNFALIMDFQAEITPNLNSDLLFLVITVGCVIAIITLLLTLVALFVLSLDLSEDSTFIHRNMFLCLLLSELVFLGGIQQINHHIACSLIAGMLQYLLLATFSWMFFECYHQYMTLIRSCDAKKSNSWWYYAVAYIVPGIITGISAAIDPSSYGTDHYCWLRADNYFVFSFVGPAVSIIFGGLVFLCIALCMFYHSISSTTAVKGSDNANFMKYRAWNRRSLLLIVLLSLTWAFAFFFINDESTVFAYAFSILNGVKGVTIIFFYCFQNEKIKEEVKKLFLHSSCFKQRKQEPQNSSEIVNSGSNSRESDPQEFWTLPKERTPASSSNIALESSTLPARCSFNESDDGVRPQNAFWMPRGNSTWKPAYYSSKNGAEEQDVVSVGFRRYNTSNVKDKGRQFFVTPESNGQFLDHIYETIDDETVADEDEAKKSFQACQRFPPPENYYGDHSDLSQHSSSSYGYDQQPLIIVGLQNGPNASQVSYLAPTGSHLNLHSDHSKQLWEQNQNQSFRRQRSPSEKSGTLRTSNEGSRHKTSSEKQVYPQKGSSELWETPLPDLLRSPPESTVVLAVLDGDKVVNRVQQDDVLIKPQYKLSTYC